MKADGEWERCRAELKAKIWIEKIEAIEEKTRTSMDDAWNKKSNTAGS